MTQLDLHGNAALSDKEIEKEILTTKTGWWPFATKHYFDPVIWANDLRRIKRLYGSHGYYQAEIEHERVTPLPHDRVAVDATIREGQPTHIASLEIRGLDALAAAEREALVTALPLRNGSVFQEDEWAAAKGQLASTLRNRGYAEANGGRRRPH